jgi:hypothetical protein
MVRFILILGYVCLFDGALRHFQQYFSYIVAVSFIGGENRRQPPVMLFPDAGSSTTTKNTGAVILQIPSSLCLTSHCVELQIQAKKNNHMTPIR